MHDIIVIGGGPAGLTAALYALRGGKSVLIIEKSAFGGQITLSPLLENYPGFSAISGSEFADKLVEQVLALGADVELDTVTGISDSGEYKTVICEGGEFRSRAIIVAAGARHRSLGLPREAELTGSGISYCAVCDGAFFRGMRVAVNGGGNTALQDAMMLSELCEKVYLIHRRDTLRGERKLEEALRRRENVEFLLERQITGFVGENSLRAIELSGPEGSETLEVDGLFIAIGYEPENSAFASLVALDEWGYAAAGEDCRTPCPGVFVAGDCRSKAVRQVTTAVGDGAVAALAACEYLDEL